MPPDIQPTSISNNMKLNFATILILFSLCFSQISAQSLKGFEFEEVSAVKATSVKNQERTGTCWSYSCTSFLESEMIRQGKEAIDLSEMYSARQTFLNKAERYLRFQGNASFSQGALGHDVIDVLADYGAYPEIVFDGKIDPEMPHDHGALEKEMKMYLDSLLKDKRNIAENWKDHAEEILDTYLGELPQEFEFEGKTYTAKSFASDAVGINPEEYVSFTSFSHHPFYKPFVLEVPDNFSHGLFYNLPIDELTQVAEYALKNGFSIEWDGDVSDKGFNPREGIAIVPEIDWAELDREGKKNLFKAPIDEKKVTQEIRQTAFDTYSLTDDHLMHLTGIVKDQTGKNYYTVKNSWGKMGPLEGYLYMSEAYFKLGTVSILVHRDAIPAEILEKLR